jgi:TolA-binding protein
MSRQVPTEDLLVLARQCRLSEEEERRLELALRSSRELECLYDAGLHFDDEAGVLPGDEPRLSRLVARTLEQLEQSDDRSTATRRASSQRAASGLRYFASSFALALLLCVTLASAWTYVEKRLGRQPLRPAPAVSRARAGASVSRPLEAPRTAPQASASRLPDAPLADPPRPHSAPPPVARQAVAEELSASELFLRANQARRKGDIEDAISLYDRLAQTYPGSSEAEDAKILRGNLLLIQRSPRAALRQFEDYHSGELSLEALWGRAQALRKLESPEERDVLLELLRDHPSSPYAEAAKKRLSELAR